nr:MAG TPA: hypothetical protein [Caudoviricetes sp.]
MYLRPFFLVCSYINSGSPILQAAKLHKVCKLFLLVLVRLTHRGKRDIMRTRR